MASEGASTESKDDGTSQELPARAKTIQVTVQAGSAREFPISVFAGCFVEYSFYTKGGDVGFGILLEKPDGTLMPVLERENVNAHEEAVTGKIKCTQSGTLWFQWDNTHSWFTSKELVYSVTRQQIGEHGEPVNSLSPTAVALNGVEKSNHVNDAANVGLSSNQVSENDPSQNMKGLKVIFGSMTLSNQVNASDSVKMLQAFVKLSESTGHLKKPYEVDTALLYNKGKTEMLLGEIFSVNPPLSQSFKIATKANPFKHSGANLRPDNVRKQLNESLKSLQVSSVDLFYLHAPDHLTDIEATLEAVNGLYLEGKFKRFGLSNYAAWEVMQIWCICEKYEWIKPTVYQGMYNGITREVEKELLPCLRSLGISFYAYNPLAGGLLSGRYTTPEGLVEHKIEELLNKQPNDGRFGLKSFKSHYKQRYWKRSYFEAVQALHAVCAKNSLTLVEASLKWLNWHSKMKSSEHDGIIIGVSKFQHLEDNMASLSPNKSTGTLPEEVVKQFDLSWEICKTSCPAYNR